MIEIPKKEPLNIVPFIDIMLVLLAMVLSISTFISKGEIKVNLPESKSATLPTSALKTDPILVQINAQGTFYWDKEEIDVSALDGHVAALKPSDPIVLRVDKDSRFDNFVKVVDVLKQYKHDNFRIETQKSGS